MYVKALTLAYVEHCNRAKAMGFLPMTRNQFRVTLMRVFH